MTHVAVIVPAHDEQALLPACLNALRAVGARLIVVADGCTDDTALVAAAGGADVVTIEERNVGRARAAGVAEALRGGALWLATTDADSRVPPNWLEWQLGHARAGADLVAGTVEVDDWSGWPGPMPSRYERRYRELVAGARHGHIHGANLGFRASAYLAAGGFPELPSDEDRGLVARIRATGGRVVTDAGCPVRTSARTDGRAPHGFAAHLRNLATNS
ncbi:glycosyltransferase involved in cell wall biosynthesis [Actinoplanes tereljensis]|uniref:4,4'-diaponeurosporenoate glycosyltransferase n=1 Tax=Paractinoplanes tereljensis TaxID=571912 RepID=A0A919TSC9_9ACTN|nr:glycosyltransferase [Actinoplanes tereljensis]GIF20119.1 glycosyl transferase [Actinoplanes tereljensis]